MSQAHRRLQASSRPGGMGAAVAGVRELSRNPPGSERVPELEPRIAQVRGRAVGLVWRF
jgi:hypothetical protein